MISFCAAVGDFPDSPLWARAPLSSSAFTAAELLAPPAPPPPPLLLLSEPIWLHVCASRAKGLFLASNCKKELIEGAGLAPTVETVDSYREVTALRGLTLLGRGDR